MKTIITLVTTLLVSMNSYGKIDRKSVVDRHRIITTKIDSISPAQVGNGEFAYGMDITGMQTFVPFNTLSNWSWHSFPLPSGSNVDDYERVPMETYGKDVPYDIINPKQIELSEWLTGNPHRFNLGRIGLKLFLSNGKEATATDIKNAKQEVDLWSGVVTSTFEIEAESVMVKSACHPQKDILAFEISSDLIRKGRLKVFFDFPYGSFESFTEPYVGDYSKPKQHSSELTDLSPKSGTIRRVMDDAKYSVYISSESNITMNRESEIGLHYFELIPNGGGQLNFTCHFTKENTKEIKTKDVIQSSANSWKDFWLSGAAIDLSDSKDPRWRELERRVVLSQYVMRVNEAGSLPPQESGLVNNSWHGRAHFEMIWWHGVHYALWNRWGLWNESLDVYQRYLPTSIERANWQGFKGARWPKCTADIDREWPHMIHATLIWQQPHPIYFAELDYRLHPTKSTLDKWREVVFNTAEFMADFANYDSSTDRYVLGPPVHVVAETTDPLITVNPTFELSYWMYGLSVANKWRDRLGLAQDKKWREVETKLAKLPIEDGAYTTYEGIPNMWTNYVYGHPASIGVYGMLPGDGVDKTVFSKTLGKVSDLWNFDTGVWGWDFPMLAMAEARLGNPMSAVDYLLHSSKEFQFDEHGLATGGPFPYFPSNGALLTAVAMMAGGWDGSEGGAPGFPKDGNWNIKHEGFVPMP